MTLWYLLASVAAFGLLWLALRAPRTDGVQHLRRRYRQRVHLPDADADAALDRHIISLRQRHPGRSERWYIERVLRDLDRDRR